MEEGRPPCIAICHLKPHQVGVQEISVVGMIRIGGNCEQGVQKQTRCIRVREDLLADIFQRGTGKGPRLPPDNAFDECLADRQIMCSLRSYFREFTPNTLWNLNREGFQKATVAAACPFVYEQGTEQLTRCK